MSSNKDGDTFRAATTYAVVTQNNDEQYQLEVGWEATEKLLGERPEEGVEQVTAFEGAAYLHLDKEGNKADVRRRIARDQIEKITGVRLEDTWKLDTGYLRLAPDHPHSLVKDLVGKEVLVRWKGADGKGFWNFHFPRQKPKETSLAELKARLAARPAF
jgi:hypothetical protein